MLFPVRYVSSESLELKTNSDILYYKVDWFDLATCFSEKNFGPQNDNLKVARNSFHYFPSLDGSL